MENELRGAMLNASIPGESLTAELGGYPWQRPPEHPTIDDTKPADIPPLPTEPVSNGLMSRPSPAMEQPTEEGAML